MYLRVLVALVGAIGFAILIGLFAVGILVALLIVVPVVILALWLTARFGGRPVRGQSVTVLEGSYRVEPDGRADRPAGRDATRR